MSKNKKELSRNFLMQKDVDYRKFEITGITLHMILVIIKHLKSYLEKFTTEIYKKMG